MACGDTFTAPSTARLGATWSGDGDGSNGAAGKGDKGGNIVLKTITLAGGNGGVGGGGGGSSYYSFSSNVAGTDCGRDGLSSTYVGAGGGGCGGKGGNATNATKGYGGGGGGGQGNSGGAGGTGATRTPRAGSINGVWGCTTDNGYGGGAGGNGSDGYDYIAGSSFVAKGGIAGASIILIAKTLMAKAIAISTGGSTGNTTKRDTTTHPYHTGSSGGGTGFCYIACGEQV